MIVTIDKAGRLVVPKLLRDQFNLAPGSELDIQAVREGMTLRKVGTEAALVRKEGILVHHGAGTVGLEVDQFVRAERAARTSHIARASG